VRVHVRVKVTRTPQGLVPLGPATYSLYFTALQAEVQGFPYYAVARATVQLVLPV
jgi:hypothetical protein